MHSRDERRHGHLAVTPMPMTVAEDVATVRPPANGDVPDAVKPPPGNPRFPLVDGVRAIAALSVVLFHTVAPSGWAGAFRQQFAVGVPVFFLVSGFLLYRPFVAGRLSGHGRIRIRDFARRRLLRIVPAFWVALTLLAIYPGLSGSVFEARSPIYYGFAQTYFPQTTFNGIYVAWSLSTEMSFYIVLPLYAILLDRLCARRAADPVLRIELGLLLLLCLGTWAFRGLIFGPHWNLAHTLGGTFDWFAIGMALAVVSAVAAHRRNTPRFITFVGSHPTLMWGGAVVAFVLAAVYTKTSGRYEPYSAGPLHYLWALVALGLLLPAAFDLRERGLPHRVLSWRVVAWLGLVSYGIFLWHAPVLGKVSAAVQQWFGLDPAVGLGLVLLVVIGGAATIGLGAASYYVVERPCLRFKEVPLLGRRKVAPSGAGKTPTRVASDPSRLPGTPDGDAATTAAGSAPPSGRA